MLLAATLLSSLALPATVHEDDPKVLDLQEHWRGPGYRLGGPAGALELGGDHYFTSGDDGPALDFPSYRVTLLSWISLDEVGASGGNDCWGYVSPSGREYAILGTNSSTAFVEISDPTYAQIIAVMPGMGSLWRDIKVYGHHAYAVTENQNGGIQVFDLSQIDAGVVTLVNTVMTGGTGASHNVAIDTASGFLYRCGGSSHGLRVYSLANPAAPQYVASWNSRYVHDAQVVTYDSGPYAGRQIAFLCSGYNGGSSQTRLEVLDVTDKSNMFVRSSVQYPNRAYSHQVWLSEDRQWAFLNDEKDEGPLPTTTHVFDVANLDGMSHAGTFTNGNTAIGHNLYTKGDLVYEANYRSGMRVFDASSPPAATEVAWFDTYPSSDAAKFNGLWSCYPYFPSGTVIGSDLEKGLFVWWVGDPPITFEYPNGAPGRLDTDGQSVDVRIVEAQAGELQAGTELLRWNDGGGWQEAPLTGLSGDAYRADFPAFDCGAAVSWYLAAESANGIEWRSPAGSPALAHRSVAAFAEVLVHEDQFEVDSGWAIDPWQETASGGRWERVDPVGTIASPEDDTTPGGTECWTTGEYGNVNEGQTHLLSPVFDLSGLADPWIGYDRWYAKEDSLIQGNDPFQVWLSNDGGDSWVLVELLDGDGPEVHGDWFSHRFRLRDFLEPTAEVQLRFQAQDEGHQNTVEAAIDGFTIYDYHCDCDGNGTGDHLDLGGGGAPDCNGNGIPDSCDIDSGLSEDLDGDGIPDECDCSTWTYCVGEANSTGPGAGMGSSGTTSLLGADFVLEVAGAVPNQFGLFFYGPDEADAAFGEGRRCVGPGSLGLFRFDPPTQTDGTGATSHAVDFTSPPAGSGPGAITAGSTWSFQFWYRDPSGGPSGFNLSNGLRARFCP